MTKHMLIDATHPEETRVVVVDGQRLEEVDVETAQKKPLKGNIYLAKVVRVEPSLQAAFVDYGGNRHGFLAFNEIHPDYYRIPIADREALLAEEAAALSEEAERDEETDIPAERAGTGEPATTADDDSTAEGDIRDENDGRHDGSRDGDAPEPIPSGLEPDTGSAGDVAADDAEFLAGERDDDRYGEDVGNGERDDEEAGEDDDEAEEDDDEAEEDDDEDDEDDRAEDGNGDGGAGTDGSHPDEAQPAEDEESLGEAPAMPLRRDSGDPVLAKSGDSLTEGAMPEIGRVEEVAPSKQAVPIETVGGDEIDEAKLRRRHLHRRYKIQEVIKRRQIMLVQVTKEERGTKGAALTTYLSLAGRYCVLMPNTGRGGGISRKISNPGDRKRLKSVLDELGIPDGMSVIVRTAGSERTKAEIRRDCDYLLRLWDGIREQTLKSTAPALIHEEANLIKRSIRDLYSRDIDDVIVEGDEGYRAAKTFMRMLMPSHAKRVQQYKDEKIPLFQRYHIESQLDAIHSPVVQLKSGGYVVLNQTEALVAIDVNSGRATRERHIEETALKTNLEAAAEIARQLRLRDLAGLIVIDFIDMEEQRHNNAVERKLKESMRQDRARIQIGRISPFGLLELSRQRLRPSLVEASTEVCRFCRGMGHVRSIESTALHMLRSIEEEAIRKPAPGFNVTAPSAVSLYILNQKRRALAEIEYRHGVRIYINGDDKLIRPDFELERLKELLPGELSPVMPAPVAAAPMPEEVFDDTADTLVEDEEEAESQAADETAERPAEREGRGRRRRRRRGRGEDRQAPREDDGAAAAPPAAVAATAGTADLIPAEAESESESESESETAAPGGEPAGSDGDRPRRRRRRGRRGGRRRRGRQRENEEPESTIAATEELADARPPRPVIPSPADFRFAGDADVLGEDEEAALDREVAARVHAPAPGEHYADEFEEPADAGRPDDGDVPVVETELPARADIGTSSPETSGTESAVAPEPPAETKPAGPRRGGWWQRRGFGA